MLSTIKRKTMSAFGIIILISIAITAVLVVNTAKVGNTTKEFFETPYAGKNAVWMLRRNFLDNQRALYKFLSVTEANREKAGTTLVEDIAFQTNILALNAAVEAARAGAAGKGFAVVADEVRNLASKSAEASQSTSGLIENAVRAVENGIMITDNTAASLAKVVEAAQGTADIVQEIAKAATRQATSVAQVSLGIDQISGVVQTNSATAEESAAASEELSGQAQTLKMLVGQFQLKNTGEAQPSLQPQAQTKSAAQFALPAGSGAIDF